MPPTLPTHPPTWCNHNLVLDSSYPKEGEVIGGVKVSHSGPRLGRQLVNQSRILHCSRIVQSAANGDACMEEKTFTKGFNPSYWLTERAHFCLLHKPILSQTDQLACKPDPFIPQHKLNPVSATYQHWEQSMLRKNPY